MNHLLLVGLGSNLGDREKHIYDAISLIETPEIKLLALSPIYESEPWGVDHQTPYLNAVAAFSTQMEADPILSHLQSIEWKMGRTSKSDLKPRGIDLDLLALGNQIVTQIDFEVPHPRMAFRKFVLQPLMEVCQGWIHPISGKSMIEMLDECVDSGWIKGWI